VELPDATTAATALYYDLAMVTANIKDFKNITDLNITNPIDK